MPKVKPDKRVGVEIRAVQQGEMVSFPAPEPGKTVEVAAPERGLFFQLINGCGGFYVPARALWNELDKLDGLG